MCFSVVLPFRLPCFTINLNTDEMGLQVNYVVKERMGSNKAPNWADQWGSYGGDEDDYEKKLTNKKDNKKMAEVKAVASAGLEKAKSAAVIGAQKVKTGTSLGFKWVKTQYQKKVSK